MRPKYEKYRDSNRGTTKLFALHLPLYLHEQIQAIAKLEADSVSGVLLEGAARVVEDGMTDRSYRPSPDDRRKHVGFRLPEGLRKRLIPIADEYSGGNLTEIIVEGAARVVNDRHDDPGYIERNKLLRLAEFTTGIVAAAETLSSYSSD